MSLNQVDRQILALLQQDASLSTAEIADKVGLSHLHVGVVLLSLSKMVISKVKLLCLTRKSLALICWFMPMFVYLTTVERT